MEFTGEIFANFFGLTQSRYQWVLDAKEQEERERRQLILENKQRAWLKQQARKRRLAKEAEADAKRDSALEGGAAVAE